MGDEMIWVDHDDDTWFSDRHIFFPQKHVVISSWISGDTDWMGRYIYQHKYASIIGVHKPTATTVVLFWAKSPFFTTVREE